MRNSHLSHTHPLPASLLPTPGWPFCHSNKSSIYFHVSFFLLGFYSWNRVDFKSRVTYQWLHLWRKMTPLPLGPLITIPSLVFCVLLEHSWFFQDLWNTQCNSIPVCYLFVMRMLLRPEDGRLGNQVHNLVHPHNCCGKWYWPPYTHMETQVSHTLIMCQIPMIRKNTMEKEIHYSSYSPKAKHWKFQPI